MTGTFKLKKNKMKEKDFLNNSKNNLFIWDKLLKKYKKF
jgi:hypothetical protein